MQDRITSAKHFSIANYYCFLIFFETWEVFQLSKTADSTYLLIFEQFGFCKIWFLQNLQKKICSIWGIVNYLQSQNKGVSGDYYVIEQQF